MGYNTRIAPSPTGDMHLGTARTAYFNWLAARASGGKFILRIDDTDQNRNDQSHIDVILQTMDWLGLDYDDLVYQSSRFDLYKQVAQNLIAKDLAKILDNGAIALVTDNVTIPTSWHDEIAGDVAITQTNLDQINNTILIKADGAPTYNWSTVVDDIDLGINYVIRGHDHITNTARHIVLYSALGYDLPKFAHVGLIHSKKKKLSKRDGAASMLYYRDQGYDPDAMLNFMLRLGWGPKTDDKSMKIIDKDRAVSLFLDYGNMRSQPSNMDLQLLDSYDRKYKARKKNGTQ